MGRSLKLESVTCGKHSDGRLINLRKLRVAETFIEEQTMLDRTKKTEKR